MQIDLTYGATLTLRRGQQRAPGPDGYEEPSVTIEQPGLVYYSLTLTAEEAITLGTWLIQQAPNMQSVIGSGEQRKEVHCDVCGGDGVRPDDGKPCYDCRPF